MEYITSSSNKRIKEFKKLKDKKYRKIKNLFVIEGKKFCLELLKSDYQIIQTLCAQTNEMLDFVKTNQFQNVIALPEDVFNSLCDTMTPQGIMCVAQCKLQTLENLSGNTLVLDALQDAGNVGTLIRSAVAFNFKNIIGINCVDFFNDKVIRASAGNIFKINLYETDYGPFIANKRKYCEHLLACDMGGANVNELKFNDGRYAVIVGNEGNGITEQLIKNCDKIVSIAMNKECESLNASVAGSIIMQKIYGGK